VGTYGCNLSCMFCQNWHISQLVPGCKQMSPEALVKLALEKRKKYPNLVGIAYTYNEPVIWYEFVRECAENACTAGLNNVLVTNGYIQEEALDEILPFINGLNVDIKAWKDEFYREYTGGKLVPVKRTVEKTVGQVWVEVTYLVIPGINDSQKDIEGFCRWLKSLDPAIPLHLSRFFPAYRWNRPPTPISVLEKLRDVASEYLHYVYIGNASGPGYAESRCPGCGKTLIERNALELRRSFLADGKCPQCRRLFNFQGKIWI
jgi:pyruvate formate lyase activating enzyme